MLVGLNEVFKKIQNKQQAVAAFNVPSLVFIRAVVDTAQRMREPVIIQHAGAHDSFISMHEIAPIMLSYAKRADIPVVVHLDHGESFEQIKQAIDLGFSSVMIDASSLPFHQNVEITKQVVEYAHAKNISVEAELGSLATSENGLINKEDIYTDPIQAKEFVQQTQVDALAASFGTAHGFYEEKPVLDFNRLKKIKEETRIPIVMHGGSGLSEEEYKKSISCGVRKINYYSYMSKEAMEYSKLYCKEYDGVFYPELEQAVYNKVCDHVSRVIEMFKNKR